MHLLALRHQRIPCQRVRVLPTNQPSDFPAALRIDDAQTVPVAWRPDQFLEERGCQFAMMVEDLSLVGDEYRGVPETSDGGWGALVEADVCEDAALRAGLLDGLHFWAVDE